MSKIDELNRHLAQLDELIRSGVLSKEAAQDARDRLQAERQRLGASSVDPESPEAYSSKPPLRMVVGIGAFVLVFAAGIYAWLGNQSAISVEPAAAPAPANAAAAHATNAQQMEGMIAKLVERLNASPNDVEGWIMLGRSYVAMGKIEDAIRAQRKVIELNPKNAHAYADLADSLALANGRNLEGEPEKVIAKALALDPDHVKALALSGTLALNRGQAAKAATLWERALKGAEPDTPMANQLQRAIAQARERAGMAASGATAPVNAGKASISGKVVLSDALKKQVSPDDAVFIYARSLQDGAPPLAIVRKQVRDLPFEFVLDDTFAMTPTSRLSLVKEARIGARISKSGTAKPQAGDLQGGGTGVVAVGTKGVSIEINEIVR
jgi:cytochrome c-type biogenesis protein CcmH